MEDNMEVMNEGMETEEARSGLGTGFAMLIGGAIALGAVAGVKAIKNKIVDLKSKKKVYADLDDHQNDNFFEEDTIVEAEEE